MTWTLGATCGAAPPPPCVSPSSSSSSSREQHGTAAPAKRPSGRKKVNQTRHPVYRGVRHRGGRWVCEVRVPGNSRLKLWLGTHVTAEAAARAHDAAMLALRGCSASAAPRLNFADSEWLLDVPSEPPDVRRAALAAVVDFQRKLAKDGAAEASVNEVTSNPSAPTSSSPHNAGSSAATSHPPADGTFEVSAVLATVSSDMFDLHTNGEMDLDRYSYYTDLANGLLLEPPPPPATCGDCGDGGTDAELWSHQRR
ncbi:hypothetical protein ZWY2020_036451 [Hordeum vulgare]|nr:hypothetical protein ZWY2020_036451 [Hordeum vulgare]